MKLTRGAHSDLAGGTGNYTISAFFNGEDGSELISNGSLLMPDSGAFAGLYARRQ